MSIHEKSFHKTPEVNDKIDVKLHGESFKATDFNVWKQSHKTRAKLAEFFGQTLKVGDKVILLDRATRSEVRTYLGKFNDSALNKEISRTPFVTSIIKSYLAAKSIPQEQEIIKITVKEFEEILNEIGINSKPDQKKLEKKLGCTKDSEHVVTTRAELYAALKPLANKIHALHKDNMPEVELLKGDIKASGTPETKPQGSTASAQQEVQKESRQSRTVPAEEAVSEEEVVPAGSHAKDDVVVQKESPQSRASYVEIDEEPEVGGRADETTAKDVAVKHEGPSKPTFGEKLGNKSNIEVLTEVRGKFQGVAANLPKILKVLNPVIEKASTSGHAKESLEKFTSTFRSFVNTYTEARDRYLSIAETQGKDALRECKKEIAKHSKLFEEKTKNATQIKGNLEKLAQQEAAQSKSKAPKAGETGQTESKAAETKTVEPSFETSDFPTLESTLESKKSLAETRKITVKEPGEAAKVVETYAGRAKKLSNQEVADVSRQGFETARQNFTNSREKITARLKTFEGFLQEPPTSYKEGDSRAEMIKRGVQLLAEELKQAEGKYKLAARNVKNADGSGAPELLKEIGAEVSAAKAEFAEFSNNAKGIAVELRQLGRAADKATVKQIPKAKVAKMNNEESLTIANYADPAEPAKIGKSLVVPTSKEDCKAALDVALKYIQIARIVLPAMNIPPKLTHQAMTGLLGMSARVESFAPTPENVRAVAKELKQVMQAAEEQIGEEKVNEIHAAIMEHLQEAGRARIEGAKPEKAQTKEAKVEMPESRSIELRQNVVVARSEFIEAFSDVPGGFFKSSPWKQLAGKDQFKLFELSEKPEDALKKLQKDHNELIETVNKGLDKAGYTSIEFLKTSGPKLITNWPRYLEDAYVEYMDSYKELRNHILEAKDALDAEHPPRQLKRSESQIFDRPLKEATTAKAKTAEDVGEDIDTSEVREIASKEYRGTEEGLQEMVLDFLDEFITSEDYSQLGSNIPLRKGTDQKTIEAMVSKLKKGELSTFELLDIIKGTLPNGKKLMESGNIPSDVMRQQDGLVHLVTKAMERSYASKSDWPESIQEGLAQIQESTSLMIKNSGVKERKAK